MAALVFLISMYSWPMRVHAARQRGSRRSARRKYSTAFSWRPWRHVYKRRVCLRRVQAGAAYVTACRDCSPLTHTPLAHSSLPHACSE